MRIDENRSELEIDYSELYIIRYITVLKALNSSLTSRFSCQYPRSQICLAKRPRSIRRPDGPIVQDQTTQWSNANLIMILISGLFRLGWPISDGWAICLRRTDGWIRTAYGFRYSNKGKWTVA